jgi:hypothetical protein
VRVALDGRGHDLVVGYAVETPIWRPSYRLVFDGAAAQVQAWGIVQNLSGEDWSGVRLSLVAGAPVSFRAELARAVFPVRPEVTDEGAVIDSVPVGDTTLAQNQPVSTAAPQGTPTAEACDSADSNCNGSVDELLGSVRSASASSANLRAFQDQPSIAPRRTTALAGLAAQGGTTRYDLPRPVTLPDRSATMVMLASREVPASQLFLFAPDPGVPDSVTHPFRVARFENRTGALLERGPLAIFEAGDYLGQALLEPLPDGATATLPFALERGLAVDNTVTASVEGARLVRMQRDALTIERFDVRRTTWRVSNGGERAARVLIRCALEGAELVEPPAGTERTEAAALVPVEAPARGNVEVVLRTRRPLAMGVDLADAQAADAITAHLRDASPPPAVATALRELLALREQIAQRTTEREELDRRRVDLRAGTEETRANLTAIQRNTQAAELRARLTARLARAATELDGLTRRIVDLDTQVSERRVRMVETARGVDIDTARPTPTP